MGFNKSGNSKAEEVDSTPKFQALGQTVFMKEKLVRWVSTWTLTRPFNKAYIGTETRKCIRL